jgi:hypothetical protein
MTTARAHLAVLDKLAVLEALGRGVHRLHNLAVVLCGRVPVLVATRTETNHTREIVHHAVLDHELVPLHAPLAVVEVREGLVRRHVRQVAYSHAAKTARDCVMRGASPYTPCALISE